MRTVTAKKQMLEDAGFAYDFHHMMYVNRDARKAFSVEFIHDHSEGELEARISEPDPPPGEWRFYFVSDISESVKRQLLAALQ